MAKNTLLDLNDHLFAQLERLDEDMTPEQLKMEICRSAAITSVGKAVIDNARLVLEGRKHMDDLGDRSTKALPDLLTGDRPLSGDRQS